MIDGTPLARARARRKLGPDPARLAALRQTAPEVTPPREDEAESPAPAPPTTGAFPEP